MSFYYLELNSLITLGKKLSLACKSKHTIYTSTWALSELLISLNESNFTMTKSRLKMILDSKILIDWDEPIYIIYFSFGINWEILNTKAIINKIIHVIIDSDNFLFFQQNFPDLYLELATYKKTRDVSNGFILSFNRIISENITLIDKKLLLNYDFEKHFITGLSKFIVSNLNLNIDHELLLRSYNGRLHLYVNALKTALFNLSNLNDNDFFDLEHILYLQNGLTYIVTNDSIFFKYKFIKAIHNFEFKQKMGIE
jgi:hypothetical protein